MFLGCRGCESVGLSAYFDSFAQGSQRMRLRHVVQILVNGCRIWETECWGFLRGVEDLRIGLRRLRTLRSGRVWDMRKTKTSSMLKHKAPIPQSRAKSKPKKLHSGKRGGRRLGREGRVAREGTERETPE